MPSAENATALRRAAASADLQGIGAALWAGVRIDDTSLDGESALHVACRCGDMPTVRMLLLLGADPNLRSTPAQNTPLEVAAEHGHVAVILSLLEKGASLPKTGRSPLHVAVKHQQWAVVSLLRARGCDPFQPDENGDTPVILKDRRLCDWNPSPWPCDTERLRDAIRRGEFVAPPWHEPRSPSVLDLARAVVRWCGGDCLPPLTEDIPAFLAQHSSRPSRHVVVVVLDGMGCATADSVLPATACLRDCRKLALRSNFPSTTTSVLTTLATCEPPATHGLLGWNMRLTEQDTVVLPLPWITPDGKPLDDLPVSAVFPVPSKWPTVPRLQHTFSPYANTTYSRYMMPEAPHTHCGNLEQTHQSLTEHLRQNDGCATFNYVYGPEPDTSSHTHGWQAPETAAEVVKCEAFLQQLIEFRDAQGWKSEDLCCVVLADHGHITPDLVNLHTLSRAHHPELFNMLRCVSGEMRYLFFHTKEGQTDAFADAFRRRFGRSFALLTAEQVEDLELFGPKPYSTVARDRMGDLVAIGLGSAMMHTGRMPVGQHGGLSPAEMHVPLVPRGQADLKHFRFFI